MVGFVTACLFAGCPTRRSPFSVNATMEGVVLAPSAFSITFAFFPSITATHELVVPRSMPITSFPAARWAEVENLASAAANAAFTFARDARCGVEGGTERAGGRRGWSGRVADADLASADDPPHFRCERGAWRTDAIGWIVRARSRRSGRAGGRTSALPRRALRRIP